MDELREKVNRAINEALDAALPEHPTLDWDVALSATAGLDSIQIMNLVMEIEDHLDVSVPVDVLADAHTLNQLAERLVELVQKT
ncbi:MAG: acyl carrier protein [Wenzhouxiangella sp.]|nr:acyl carrier protein [Wenzhouxiangella sp.]